MKKIQIIVLIYSGIFTAFTLLYLLLFHSSLLNNQTVLFYRGVMLLVITTFIFLILAVILYLKLLRTSFESLIAAVFISAAIHLSMFIVFPVSFERSITMYFLSSLQNGQSGKSCQGLTKSQIEQKLINGYIIKNKALDKRIHEQSVINFIENKDECVELTAKGHNFLNFSQYVKRLYNVK